MTPLASAILWSPSLLACPSPSHPALWGSPATSGFLWMPPPCAQLSHLGAGGSVSSCRSGQGPPAQPGLGSRVDWCSPERHTGLLWVEALSGGRGGATAWGGRGGLPGGAPAEAQARGAAGEPDGSRGVGGAGRGERISALFGEGRRPRRAGGQGPRTGRELGRARGQGACPEAVRARAGRANRGGGARGGLAALTRLECGARSGAAAGAAGAARRGPQSSPSRPPPTPGPRPRLALWTGARCCTSSTNSSWTPRTLASLAWTPLLVWCTAMSCLWTPPSWTCWWPWPRATSGARSATRSSWTWSVVGPSPGQRGGTRGRGCGDGGAVAATLGPCLPDRQQALQQLQAGHRQRTAGAAQGRAAGRARPGLLQALRAVRGLRDPALRGGPPLVLLQAPQLPAPRVHGLRHPGADRGVPVLRGAAQQVGAADLPPRVHEEPPRVPPGAPGPRLVLPHLHVHARGAGAAGVQRPAAADDRGALGDGARPAAHQPAVPGRRAGRLPDRVHHRHAGPRGGGLRRGLRPVLGAPGQRRHELGWDAVPVQAAADGAGPGVHELGGGPRRVAALLAAAARRGPAAQLHGAPGGRRGGREHGPHHPAQLRGAPAGPVRLVGGPAGLRHLPALRHLLERLRLRPAGRPRPPAALTAPGHGRPRLQWWAERPWPRPAPRSAPVAE